MSAFLEIDRLSKRFGDLRVLDGVALSVEEGEVLALLGPSGSGKTTFLRLLAGFETPDEGAIRAGNRRVETLPPARRGFGMVFQHYALFPHLTVRGNVAFGLETTGTPRAATDARVAEVLALVDLEGFEDRRIEELSGGQQQRVALARALAPHPRLLLLDEPLSNLDPELRERTRRELLVAIRRVGITTVLVTHEQEEAFYLGNRVAVLWRGRLQQVGSPEELYLAPANPFVARFIGRSSTLPGRIDAVEPDGRCRVRLSAPGGPGAAGGRAEAPEPTTARRDGADRRQAQEPVWQAVLPEALRGDGRLPAPGDAVELVVRPEALRLGRHGDGPGPAGSLTGRVILRRYGGPVTYYRVVLEHGEDAGADGGAGSGSGAPGEVPPTAGPELEVLADAGAAAQGDGVWIEPAGSGPEPRAFPLPGRIRASGRDGGAGDREPEASP